jgi:hypothetical protein
MTRPGGSLDFMTGREGLFERERQSEPTHGWHSCDLACAGLPVCGTHASGQS